MLTLSLGVLSTLMLSNQAFSKGLDCKLRFALVQETANGKEYVTMAELDNRSLDLDLNTTYRFELNYRLNESKPWSPKPKVTGGKTSVIAGGSSFDATILGNPAEGPQVLYITPTTFTSLGQVTLNVRTGGLVSEGTIDEPSGNASCENVDIFFRTYRPETVRVKLFQDVGFSGRQTRLQANESVSNLRYTSLGNDELSSIMIPRGCSVTLYRDKNYTGQSVTLSAVNNDLSVYDLKTYNFADKASSVVTSCKE